ncbi:hypothetical protein J6590_029343 [Homalodisca vitripennis]|nr:hypothetical protein J6590_029343 [Homalodisca vitripennis]
MARVWVQKVPAEYNVSTSVTRWTRTCDDPHPAIRQQSTMSAHQSHAGHVPVMIPTMSPPAEYNVSTSVTRWTRTCDDPTCHPPAEYNVSTSITRWTRTCDDPHHVIHQQSTMSAHQSHAGHVPVMIHTMSSASREQCQHINHALDTYL